MQQDVNPQEVSVEPTFGGVLAQARKEKGYSIEDVAASLKLRPRQILALEEGHLDQLSGATYTRGMIRNYAKLLGIDPEPLVAQVGTDSPDKTLDSNCFTPEKLKVIGGGLTTGIGSTLTWRPNRFLVFCAGVAIVLALAIWVVPDGLAGQVGRFFANQTAKVTQWWSSASAPVQTQEIEVPEATEMGVGAAESTEPVPTEFMASEPVLATEKIPDPEKNQLMGLAVSSPMPVSQATLKMGFEEDAWVEIREQRSRKTIFAGLVVAGSEQTFTGNLPLELKVGNASFVSLNFNGTDVGLSPYTRQGVARLLLQ